MTAPTSRATATPSETAHADGGDVSRDGHGLRFIANLVRADHDPLAWSAQREAEGYSGVAVSDHLWLVKASPHVFVTLAAMATATSRVQLMSAFANNLFRSPVEFAQASLGLHSLSKGRFEAGLGAGWMAEEMERTGRSFPDGPTRARRYVEALEIVRELLHTGACRFAGEHYEIDVDRIGPLCEEPPALVASAGGPWLLERVPAMVDRFDIIPSSSANRGGHNDHGALAAISEDDVRQMVDTVRDTAPEVPLGVHILVGVGTHPYVETMRTDLDGSFHGRFYGDAQTVAGALFDLRDLGFSRVLLSPELPGTFEALAPLLHPPTTLGGHDDG